METMNNLIGWIQQKIDQIFGFFGFYTQNYSKALVYGLLIFVGAKMLKINTKLDITNRRN